MAVRKPRPDPYPQSTRDEAIELASNIGVSKAGRELGIERHAIAQWLKDADPQVLTAIVARRKAEASVRVAERLARYHDIVDDALELAATPTGHPSNDLATAKRARELSTAYGIMHDKVVGGQVNPGSRFGGESSMSDAARGAYEMVMTALNDANPALLAPSVIDVAGGTTVGDE